MTTLRDGTVVDESITAANYTAAANVPGTFGQGPRRVESITIHHWGLEGQDFDAVVRYLASANPRGSSAHAVIMAGRATALVNPDDAAWHAGNPYGAATSIGLELRPEATPGDYTTAAAYIAFLRGIYGNVPLVPHNKWTNTACPGKWDLAKLDRLARNSTTPPVTKQEKPAVAEQTEHEKTREYIGQLLVAGYGVGSVRKQGIAKQLDDITKELAAIKAALKAGSK